MKSFVDGVTLPRNARNKKNQTEKRQLSSWLSWQRVARHLLCRQSFWALPCRYIVGMVVKIALIRCITLEFSESYTEAVRYENFCLLNSSNSDSTPIENFMQFAFDNADFNANTPVMLRESFNRCHQTPKCQHNSASNCDLFSFSFSSSSSFKKKKNFSTVDVLVCTEIKICNTYVPRSTLVAKILS